MRERHIGFGNALIVIADLAIILWIFISVVLFAMLPPLRAFLLTYMIGMLVLPVEVSTGYGYLGSIDITQSLRIDKLAACNIGALLGTMLFAPHVFRRYRFHWIDAAYGVILAGMFATSIMNGQGAKDGISNSVDNLRAYLPVLILSRLYITSVGDLYQAMRALIGGAFLYSFLCVAEFRLAPQTHNLIYGYFPHAFDEFVRYDHFRPLGFFRHAIELSFFMGTATGLACWLWFKGLLKPLWGMVPAWAVVGAMLVGLACTLTFSGYAAFLICVAMFGISQIVSGRWVMLLLPLIAIVWMAGRYTNAIDAGSLLHLANWFDPARGASLEYRLEAERVNLSAASQSFVFGKSAANGVVRAEDGRVVMAVDAWWMITLVFFGIIGLAGWYAVWSAGLITAFIRWKQLTPDFQTLSIAVAILIGAQFFDFLFNAFPSVFLMILNVGLIGAIQRFQPVRFVRRVMPAEMARMPQGAMTP
jgi:hypothetical protein